MMRAPTPTEAAFIADMRAAGRTVNWFTFLDGTTAPTVCGGSRGHLQRYTAVPLTSRFLGNTMEIVWPATECRTTDSTADAGAAMCAHSR
jgi:hypothetical protein